MFFLEQRLSGNKWGYNLELVEIHRVLSDKPLVLQMNFVSGTHLCNQDLRKQVLYIQFGFNIFWFPPYELQEKLIFQFSLQN